MKNHAFTIFMSLALAFTVMAYAAKAKAAGDVMMNADNQATAILAAGCFWCIESDLEKLPGITAVESGYTGGTVENPSYEQVSHGGTGHYEAVRVFYDPAKIEYKDILHHFWRNVDPFDQSGQFCDKGDQYRAAIFYQNEEEKSRPSGQNRLWRKRLGRKIVTQILPAATFYPAEDYHQDYYKKTRPAINSIAGAAAAMPALIRYGAAKMKPPRRDLGNKLNPLPPPATPDRAALFLPDGVRPNE